MYLASLYLQGDTWWPNVASCLEVNRNRKNKKSEANFQISHTVGQEICPHVAVKVWWGAWLEICWMCSSTCYAPIQCQTSTIIEQAYISKVTLDCQTLPGSWKSAEIGIW